MSRAVGQRSFAGEEDRKGGGPPHHHYEGRHTLDLGDQQFWRSSMLDQAIWGRPAERHILLSPAPQARVQEQRHVQPAGHGACVQDYQHFPQHHPEKRHDANRY